MQHADLEGKIYPRGREWPDEVRALPPIDQRLIAHLEALYPDRAPNPGMVMEEVWFKAGQASVVRHLVSLYERQQELNMGYELQGVA